MAKKKKKKHPQNINNKSPRSIKGNNSQDESNDSSIKKYLKKIFTWQKVAVYVAVIVGVISYFGYQHQKNQSIKEDIQREQERLEKILETKNNQHDFLTLKLDCFDLSNGTYDVDYLLNNDEDFDSHFISLGTVIYNGGTKSAKNTKLEILSPEGVQIAAIFKVPYAKDTILTESRNFGIISFEDFIPGLTMGTKAMFAKKINQGFKQGEKLKFHFRLYCEDKARAVLVDFNLNLFKYKTIQEYVDHISQNKNIYGDFKTYFNKKDFIIAYENVNGSISTQIFQVEAKSDTQISTTTCNKK